MGDDFKRLFSTIELRNITKRFPGVIACDQISLEIREGEVLALLGENGAGKTTLMRVLYGIHQPDDGQILIDGEPVVIKSPAAAIHNGIGMVHQHFMLVPTLTVAANVALGLPSSRGVLLDLDRVSRRVAQLSKTYGLKVDPDAYVWQLGVGEQQRVEILKALYRGARLLILDEPTAVLTPQEVEGLFQTLRKMLAEGHGIIFISHKLNEVMTISDRVAVLRQGRLLDTLSTSSTNARNLARLMVGRDVRYDYDLPAVETGTAFLQLCDLSADSDRRLPAVRGVSLELRAGEILGIAGVSGNGQRELAETVAGLRQPTKGQVVLGGIDATAFRPDQMIAIGLAYIPEERMRDGVVKAMTVEENLMLEDAGRSPFARAGFLDFGCIGEHCDHLIKEYEIKTPTRQTKLGNLSGGNIQKMIMARALWHRPRVLIAAQPTRGVDIGSTEYIHQRLIAARSEGAAILLISEDLDEIRRLSDRIAVMYEGAIMGILSHAEASVEKLGLLMAGVRLDETLTPCQEE